MADSDALVVKILRKAGAILYVKTQNPQTLLVGDTLFIHIASFAYLIFSHLRQTTTYSVGLSTRLIAI